MPQHPARSAYSLALKDGRLERFAGIIEELVGSNVSLDLCGVDGAPIVCETKAKSRGGTVADHEEGQERESGGKAEGHAEQGRLLWGWEVRSADACVPVYSLLAHHGVLVEVFG